MPKSFFQSVDGLITSFIWAGKAPRIQKKFLQRHRSRGGLGLPNLQFYYWAANCQKILYWCQSSDMVWCEAENNSCLSTSLPALVTSKLPLSISTYTSNPIVINTLRIWQQIRKHMGSSDFSIQAPICHNHLFLPAKIDATFLQWKRQGLFRFKDFYKEGVFASFNDMCEKFNVNRSSHFRYLQIRQFIRSNTTDFPNEPDPSFTLWGIY